MKTIKTISITLIIVLVLPLLYQCKDKELDKKMNADDYISKESLKNFEKLNDFYTIAISNTKEKIKKGIKTSSGEAMLNDIESQVAQLCRNEFRNDFNLEYNKFKNLQATGDVIQEESSGIDEQISLSEYAVTVNSEINSTVDQLFDGDATPTEDEMKNAITLKLNSYKKRIAIDNNLSETDKSYLINSIAGQLLFLPTTFSIIDFVAENTVDSSQKSLIAQKGWLKKAWKKVSRVVNTVGEWGLAALVLSKGNPLATIAGLVVGIGSAIYCENNGYDHCVCQIVSCALNKNGGK